MSIFLQNWRSMFNSNETSSKGILENNMHHHGTIETILKHYLSNWEFSLQEAVYHNLPELMLRRVFPAGYFVNTNLSEERVQVLFSEKGRRELPDNRQNIFRKSNIYHYAERPSPTLCNKKYDVKNYFCYPEFLAYYTLERNQVRPLNTSHMNMMIIWLKITRKSVLTP